MNLLAGKKEQILTEDDIKEYLTNGFNFDHLNRNCCMDTNVTLKIAKAMLNSTKGILR